MRLSDILLTALIQMDGRIMINHVLTAIPRLSHATSGLAADLPLSASPLPVASVPHILLGESLRMTPALPSIVEYFPVNLDNRIPARVPTRQVPSCLEGVQQSSTSPTGSDHAGTFDSTVSPTADPMP